MAFIKDHNRSRGVGAIAAIDGVTRRRMQQRQQANRVMALRDQRLARETIRAFGAVDARGDQTAGGGSGGGSTGPLRIMATVAPAGLRLPARVSKSPIIPTGVPIRGKAGQSTTGTVITGTITDPVLTSSGGSVSTAPPPAAADASVDAVDPDTLFPADAEDTAIVETVTTTTPPATGPNWLLWGGLAVGAYLLWTSRES